jgi:hypothetical protein
MSKEKAKFNRRILNMSQAFTGAFRRILGRDAITLG